MPQAKILITEDDQASALLLKTSLENLGYEVVGIVSTGIEAISFTKKHRPNLVMMDIDLPGGMDGIATTKKIREHLDTPVIYVTNSSDNETLQKAISTEPSGYVLKPFQIKELYSTVEMALYKQQIERQLKENERLLSVTLKSIGDGVITTDMDSKVTFMNPIASALTGRLPIEALGQDLNTVLEIIDEQTGERFINTPFLIEQDKTFSNSKPLAIVSKSGNRIPIDESLSTIMDDQDKVLGMIVTFRDITLRRRAEEELKTLNNELEQRVKERTLELEKALNKEKELNELKTRIVTMMSHEFRTPLTSIMSSSQLIDKYLVQDAPQAKVARHSGRIQRSVTLLTDLLNDILFIGKAEASQIDFTPRHLEIDRFFKEIIEEAKLATGQTASIIYKPEALPNSILADPKLLRQILSNLLSNAIKYSPQGTPTEVKASCVDGMLELSVRDEGIGIPEKDQESLFNQFFRASNAETIEGTGLGLAIVKKSVELHQGSISFESTSGKGTTFYVKIPIN